ncbi:MAG TPA: flagellar hook-length control protein FliK [Nocardioidaceae bacterium]|nr:flagellar hook-length control protein FliK [Nocardioidaceae bacterium]
MTITPVAAPAANLPAGTSGGGTQGSEFESLVQKHLAEDPAGSGDLSREVASAILEAASAPSAVPSDGLAMLLAGLIAAPVPGSPAAGSPAAERTSAGTPDVATVVGGGGPVLKATQAASGPGAGGVGGAGAVGRHVGLDPHANVPGSNAGALTSELVASADAAPAAGNASTDLLGGQAAVAEGAPQERPVPTLGGTETGAEAAHRQPGGGAAKAVDGVQPGATSAGSSGPAESAGATSSGGTGSATNAVAAAAASSGTGLTTSVGTTSEPSSAVPVADQVFEPVSRLVSRGDGTHRLTLRLHPADLGEVKVVLSAKDGNVEVTVSGGPEACEALREGSPRLRALLELAGAGSTTVVVRELGTGAIVSSTGAGQQAGLATGSDAGLEAGRQGAGDHEADASSGSADDRGSDEHPPGRSRAGTSVALGRPGSRSSIDIDI